MIATNNQQTSKENFSAIAAADFLELQKNTEQPQKLAKIATSSQILLPRRLMTHNPKSGLNPLVDAASYLLSILGKLKGLKNYRQCSKLQKDLIQEFTLFQESITQLGYNPEYIVVCRYILCATYDDVFSNTLWGSHNQWDSYSLLAAFNQDTQHHDKFFNILERALKEPTLYIDLMELIYICLSMGYKGQYRSTEHNHYQLEQITNNLYKHIRAYRGSFSKTLSPLPLKTGKITVRTKPKNISSLLLLFFVTACVVMTIFISLGYLMDVISNEAYKNITQVENQTTSNNSK